ncbi:MAG: glycosyltransferase [Gammaproteobacteria bacterium]
MKFAPIILFVYNRPVHTRRAVEKLLQNAEVCDSELFVYSDAPKNPEAGEAVREVRAYIRTISGFRSVNIIERDKNWGLAASIIDGVTSVVNKYGRIIVLEDDLVVSPHFLGYMNAALERYQDNERIMQISGHIFPAKLAATTDAVFLSMTTSWGWATWTRAWKHFDTDAKGYAQLKQDAVLQKRFNLDGAYDYFSMLEAQLSGRVDSWAIRWYLSVFMLGGLVLFPVKSLVKNVGFDGSGTHCGAGESAVEFTSEFNVKIFPPVVEDSAVQQAINRYLIEQRSYISGLRAKLAKWLRPNMSWTI